MWEFYFFLIIYLVYLGILKPSLNGFALILDYSSKKTRQMPNGLS